MLSATPSREKCSTTYFNSMPRLQASWTILSGFEIENILRLPSIAQYPREGEQHGIIKKFHVQEKLRIYCAGLLRKTTKVTGIINENLIEWSFRAFDNNQNGALLALELLKVIIVKILILFDQI